MFWGKDSTKTRLNALLEKPGLGVRDFQTLVGFNDQTQGIDYFFLQAVVALYADEFMWAKCSYAPQYFIDITQADLEYKDSNNATITLTAYDTKYKLDFIYSTDNYPVVNVEIINTDSNGTTTIRCLDKEIIGTHNGMIISFYLNKFLCYMLWLIYSDRKVDTPTEPRDLGWV